MTNSFQPVLVGVPQSVTSDKSLEEVDRNIRTASMAMQSSGQGNPNVPCERAASLKGEVASNPEQSLVLPLQQTHNLPDTETQQRMATGTLQNDESVSGRRNPGPAVPSAEAALRISTSLEKTHVAAPAAVIALPDQAKDARISPKPPGNDGAVGRDAVAVKVIRPFPVKTMPKTSGPGPTRPFDDISIPAQGKEEDSRERKSLASEGDKTLSRENEDKGNVATRAQDAQSQNQGTRKLKASQCDFPPHPGHQQPMPSGSGAAPDFVIATNRNNQQNTTPHAQQKDAGYHQQRGAQQPYLQSTVNLMSMSGASGGIRQPRSRNPSASGANMDMDGGTPTAVGPTPLFERLVSEEVQEIKTYARIVESQNRQIEDLERVHDDLEQRLEALAKERAQLEATLEDRERSWSAKFAEKEKERAKWEKDVKVEKKKNEWLQKTVGQKDKDIHYMLARKYDTKRDQQHNPRNLKPPANQSERSRTPPLPVTTSKTVPSLGTAEHHKSPHELLFASGSIEAVREGNVADSLLDFFGM